MHDGLIAGTACRAGRGSPANLLANCSTGPRTGSGLGQAGLTIVFRPDPTVWDGRFANNGWLQELPKPHHQAHLGQRRPGQPGHRRDAGAVDDRTMVELTLPAAGRSSGAGLDHARARRTIA